MIKIGKLTDYALLILGKMATHPDELVSASTLADMNHLSIPTTSKILKLLAEGGLVSSVRGAVGGYRLAKDPSEIMVAEVIEIMEGGVAITSCCNNVKSCAIDSTCQMRENWRKINKAVLGLLNKISVVDMQGTIAIPGVACE